MAEENIPEDPMDECPSETHKTGSSAKDFSCLTDIYWVCFHLYPSFYSINGLSLISPFYFLFGNENRHHRSIIIMSMCVSNHCLSSHNFV